MGYFEDTFRKLTKQLLPSGRAFRMLLGGNLDNFSDGINDSENELINDIHSIYDSIFPDNPNFTVDDATNWERTLGVISNPNTDLEDRKSALIRKLNHPGNIKPRQNYRYLQKSLRAAGFDVYVYPNRFETATTNVYEAKTFSEFAISSSNSEVKHGQIVHGQSQHGQKNSYKIVNSIYPHIDATFDIGDGLFHTFFICGATQGVNAVIPESREIEFRELVLRLKPVQSVCLPLISFTDPVIDYLSLEDGSLFLMENGDYLVNYAD